jgi:phage regulator Rha-like protein
MNSKWNLLPNNTNKQLYLKEENRKEPMIIYNDNKGTQIMSSFVLSLLDKFNEIKTIGIDTLRIDSWLINKKQLMEEVLNWLNLFNQKSNKFKITNSYHNFWDMNKKDLIYLKNEYEK